MLSCSPGRAGTACLLWLNHHHQEAPRHLRSGVYARRGAHLSQRTRARAQKGLRVLQRHHPPAHECCPRCRQGRQTSGTVLPPCSATLWRIPAGSAKLSQSRKEVVAAQSSPSAHGSREAPALRRAGLPGVFFGWSLGVPPRQEPDMVAPASSHV